MKWSETAAMWFSSFLLKPFVNRVNDPGAGKTIMAGLPIKELLIRGDLHRCMIVCPGNLAEQWQDELYQRFQPFRNTDERQARIGAHRQLVCRELHGHLPPGQAFELR